MKTATACWRKSAPGTAVRQELLVRKRLKLARGRPSVDDFIEACFTDPSGRPLFQADVHRDLQAFLSANRRALVELPRDHGKSTQVCASVAWELGRDPSLRVVIVCASEALAAARGRFVREAIESYMLELTHEPAPPEPTPISQRKRQLRPVVPTEAAVAPEVRSGKISGMAPRADGVDRHARPSGR